MIKTVKNRTPKEWIQKDSNPVFPICCFSINTVVNNIGREQVYSVQFFFLDKSGQEAEFETDVISDQIQTANDIISMIRFGGNDYYIDDSVTINSIADKYEDYLAGAEVTINITTTTDFDKCDVPII
jgi:hypothetical protein